MKSFGVIFALLVVPAVVYGENLAEVLSKTEGFSTLVTAVKAAGLVETLSGEGPFTVLAPNNDAFAKIPKETLDDLLADVPALKKTILSHVIKGKILAADVTSGDVLTVSGATVVASVSDDGVTFTSASGTVAKVIKTDVLASNGVAHVIDTVL